MGECLIVRRGGESYELPTLDASYPKDATVTAAANGSASFSISITTPGRPAEYTPTSGTETARPSPGAPPPPSPSQG